MSKKISRLSVVGAMLGGMLVSLVARPAQAQSGTCKVPGMEQRRLAYVNVGMKVLDTEIAEQYARSGDVNRRREFVNTAVGLAVSVVDFKGVDARMDKFEFERDLLSGITSVVELANTRERPEAWTREVVDTIVAAGSVVVTGKREAAVSFLTEKSVKLFTNSIATFTINALTKQANTSVAVRDILSAYYLNCGDNLAALRQLNVDAKACPTNGGEHWLLCSSKAYATRKGVDPTKTRARVELFIRGMARFVAAGSPQ
jgi:hypothetical protein